MKKSNRLTVYILIAMALGICVGAFIHNADKSDEELAVISKNISIITTVFLSLIKMIIAPLVLSTLVVGIAKMGDMKALGRIGGKAMAWFITASIISLSLGMLLVNLFKPGTEMHLALPEESTTSLINTDKFSLVEFITHVFPTSIIQAMANNEILQIVVFSIFFGVAASAIGEKAAPIIKALDALAHIMLKITGYVMKFAPFAVFASFASVISLKGLSILGTYGYLITEFYLGLFILWALIIFVGYSILKKRIIELLRRIKEPFLIAFSTSSSEAAFPKFIEELERFGCNNKIVSFVLPLGYSFNLDGSMMFMSFGSIFIAQSYGIEMDFATQLSMLFVLMITSKGIAGVPKASLVVVAATLTMFGIPEAGIGLIFGIDTFLDMGRSATNVIGNAVATASISKWENALED